MTEETQVPDPSLGVLGYFARRMKHHRELRGWSQRELARKLFATQATISKLESAKQLPTLKHCRDLDELFGTDGAFVDLFDPMQHAAYPAWFLPWVQLEEQATSIRTLHTQVIPGLLQTEAYARAMLTPSRLVDLDSLLAARMSRQAILERADRPRLWAILDWPVFHRMIGGPQVMRAQLQHLLDALDNPLTVIQVIDEANHVHPGVNGVFSVMSLPNHADVLHTDAFIKGRMSYDPAEVAEANRTYDLLRGDAQSPQKTADFIRQQLKGVK